MPTFEQSIENFRKEQSRARNEQEEADSIGNDGLSEYYKGYEDGLAHAICILEGKLKIQ